MLEKQLGFAFAPETHWTSSLRSKAGLSPFSKDDTTASTFTIKDVHGNFSNLLTRNGYRKAASWRPSPTFHVEVVPSDGGLTEAFCLDPNQVRKVSTIARYLYECLIKQRDSDSELDIASGVCHDESLPIIFALANTWILTLFVGYHGY